MARSTWNFDPAHSEISFRVRHMMFSKVSGYFQKWEGHFEFDPENPGDAVVSVDIDASSIDTGNEDRDGHLRSGDFLDVENHPVLHFESQDVTSKQGDELLMRGELTIRETTRPVELEVEYHGKATDPWGNDRVGFTGRTKLNRKDFGLTWNQVLEAGGVLVGDEVEVEIHVQATPAE